MFYLVLGAAEAGWDRGLAASWLDHPDDHPDDPNGSFWTRLDRRRPPPEQDRSDQNRSV
jgi:hypothetical protein